MKPDVNIKKEQIVEVAIRRFSHFGVHKTTLSEIAEDAGVSKQLLFYYFNDKLAIVAAVADKIFTEYLHSAEEMFKASATTEDAIKSIIEVKRRFLEKYFLLAIQNHRKVMIDTTPELSEVFQIAREKEKSLLSGLLQKGITRKELKEVDTDKTSELILQTLTAFEHCIKDKSGIPEPAAFNDMFERQQQVVELFLNGLKSPTWKN